MWPTKLPVSKVAAIVVLLGVFGLANDSRADAPKSGMVQFPSGTGTEMVSGFVAEPATAVRHPGVIVIHTWWGLNDWVKQQTEKLAELGFVAVAVDLYDGHVAIDPSAAQD